MIEYIIYESVETLEGKVCFKTLDKALKHFASLEKGSRSLMKVTHGKKVLSTIPILFDDRWNNGELIFMRHRNNTNYCHCIKRRHINKYGIH